MHNQTARRSNGTLSFNLRPFRRQSCSILPRQLSGHTALGKNAAKATSPRCHIDHGAAGFIPVKMQVLTASRPM